MCVISNFLKKRNQYSGINIVTATDDTHELQTKLMGAMMDAPYQMYGYNMDTHEFDFTTGSQLSQNTAIFYANGEYIASFTVAGSGGRVTENLRRITLTAGENRITVKYPKDALSVTKICVYREQ